MAVAIAFYDRGSAERIPIRDDEWWERTRRYIVPLLQHGSAAYVANARVEMGALAVDDQLLPIVFGCEREPNPAVCSLYAHYAGYSAEEMAKRHPGLPRRIVDALLWPLRLQLQLGAVDRTVFVNNWLIPTNPTPRLSVAQIEAVTRFLAARYPDRAIVFRTVNPVSHRRYRDDLARAGYRLIRCRRVYLLDPTRGHPRKRSNLTRDRDLADRTGYRQIHDRGRLTAAAERLSELFRLLYLDKHSRLNPDLTPAFFRLTVEEGILRYRAIAKDGRIHGFASWYERDGSAVAAGLGYDTTQDRKLGLYRQAFALLTAHAADHAMSINLSAGADAFKLFRGGRPVEECDAIYDRHLPAVRRFAFTVLEAATRIGSRRRVDMPAAWHDKHIAHDAR